MSNNGERMGHPETSISGLFLGSATMGERGQIVVPSEARKEYGMQAGDKLLVFRHPHMRGLVLAKVDDVRAVLDEMEHIREVMSSLDEGNGTREESEGE